MSMPPKVSNIHLIGMDTSIADHLDRESDYGSDFTADEEKFLNRLLQQPPSTFKSDLDFETPQVDCEDNEKIRVAISHPKQPYPNLGRRGKGGSLAWNTPANKTRTSIALEGYGSTSTALEKRESRLERESKESSEQPSSDAPKGNAPDLRSPLERFRTKPKKTLSVTDLISPSWCELQYWYSLTKHGKKRTTPAMRQGSAVHKKLEDQVHQTVAVDVQTKEDAWGLRIWNVIQGLRTLRATGMTRELEIWGLVEGLVVNGVIDELSYMCPDRELEEAAGPGLINKNVVPPDQTTIESYLQPAFSQNNGPGVLRNLKSLVKKTSQIYLTDVKTRGVNTVPRGAAFRPTLMQLMLYHRLLSDLAAKKVDPATIFDRYSLDSVKTFSDSFIAQFGNLNETFSETSSDPDSSQEPFSDPTQAQDAIQLLLDHNSLTKLWALMTQEFERTMTNGAASIGSVLKVEYRAQRDGSVMGIKTFLYDDEVIQSYLADEIRWWRGEREAQGVCEEEAYKCGSCEFAEECTWRKEKIEEATQRHRTRTSSVV